ncbi:MAG: hypothetical protein N2423_04710, partial [Novosphingobium sp.]|nr:hypothetical protein [Novosphingobium sp.]
MTDARPTRGKPLVALVLLIAAWVGFRTMFWDAAAISATGMPQLAASPTSGVSKQQAFRIRTPIGPQSSPDDAFFALSPDDDRLASWRGQGLAAMPNNWGPARLAGVMRRQAHAPDHSGIPFLWGGHDRFEAPPLAPVPAPLERPVPVRLAIAHQMMWMAAVSQMALPAELFAMQDGNGAAADMRRREAAAMSGKRWSVDSWLLHRRGGRVSLANGILPATYGASQFGAVLRYRLAPNSNLRPAAYLRTTSALNGSQEQEVAAGLSARPFARLPVAVAAELRATVRPGSSMMRPAVLAWTEMPPFDLPLKARGELYAQAGYVGGKFGTPFADGQLRVDRGVMAVGRAEVRAGGGAWAGVQKGASRVDVGPSATLGLPISRSASARVGVD